MRGRVSACQLVEPRSQRLAVKQLDERSVRWRFGVVTPKGVQITVADLLDVPPVVVEATHAAAQPEARQQKGHPHVFRERRKLRAVLRRTVWTSYQLGSTCGRAGAVAVAARGGITP